jgi:hypothetical protein
MGTAANLIIISEIAKKKGEIFHSHLIRYITDCGSVNEMLIFGIVRTKFIFWQKMAQTYTIADSLLYIKVLERVCLKIFTGATYTLERQQKWVGL